jgi:hypothetical protein
MVVVIPKNDSGTTGRTILVIMVIIVIAIVIFLIWYFIIRLALNGTLFPRRNVECTTSPNTPSNLSATVQGNRVYLTWNSVETVDSYIVYMGDSALFFDYEAIRTIESLENSVAVLNVIPGTFYFKVLARNTCGDSTLSSEVSVGITTWPSKFKLCKKNDLNICLILEQPDTYAVMSETCPGTLCELSYPDQITIKRENSDICLDQNNPGGFIAEAPVGTNDCSTPIQWNFNLNTGRIFSGDNLCLGAESEPGTIAYNTDCALIFNPDDGRYAWDLQALTF